MAIQLELPFNEYKVNKYKISNNYFNFEIFEDIFKVINERASTNDDHMFKAGVASAEAAVRRLREKYYDSVKEMLDREEEYYKEIRKEYTYNK